MNVITLLFTGGLIAVLLIGYAGARVLTRRTGMTVLHILLALLAIGLIFAALIRNHLAASGQPGADRLALTMAGLLMLAGIVVALLERRRQVNPNQASGLVVTGAGILLGVLILAAPATVTRMVTVQTPGFSTESTGQIPSGSDAEYPMVMLVTNTPRSESMPSAASEQQGEQRSFVLTPLPTRYVPATPTTTPTPNLATGCLGTVQDNLNLRTGPGTGYERLTTIPHNTRLDIYAQNADASWLWIGYDETNGWVSAEYVALAAECDELPQRDS